MTDITIPPEAIEAAAIELAPALWSMYTEDAREHFRRKARAVCLAMLKAWPEMEIEMVFVEEDYLILPLPNENSNAEV